MPIGVVVSMGCWSRYKVYAVGFEVLDRIE